MADLGSKLNDMERRLRALEDNFLGHTTPTGDWLIEDRAPDLLARDRAGNMYDLCRPTIVAHVTPTNPTAGDFIDLTGNGAVFNEVDALSTRFTIPGDGTVEHMVRIESAVRAAGNAGSGSGALDHVQVGHRVDGIVAVADAYFAASSGEFTHLHWVTWHRVAGGPHTIEYLLAWSAATVDVRLYTDTPEGTYLSVTDWGALRLNGDG